MCTHCAIFVTAVRTSNFDYISDSENGKQYCVIGVVSARLKKVLKDPQPTFTESLPTIKRIDAYLKRKHSTHLKHKKTIIHFYIFVALTDIFLHTKHVQSDQTMIK